MTQITFDKALINNNNKPTTVEVAKDIISSEQEGIIVDCHEPEEIILTLRKEKGIHVIVKRLDVGDYMVGKCIIERKTLSDFYGSIVSGDKRIWSQVFNLKRASDKPCLIIERWNDAFFNDLRKERAVFGALARIYHMGINIMIFPGFGKDCKNFVEFLTYLFYSSDKKIPSLKPVPAKNAATPREIMSDMICMIPLIGRKQADEISQKIQSLEELCKMSNEALKEMSPGLGPKRLAMIRCVLHGKT